MESESTWAMTARAAGCCWPVAKLVNVGFRRSPERAANERLEHHAAFFLPFRRVHGAAFPPPLASIGSSSVSRGLSDLAGEHPAPSLSTKLPLCALALVHRFTNPVSHTGIWCAARHGRPAPLAKLSPPPPTAAASPSRAAGRQMQLGGRHPAQGSQFWASPAHAEPHGSRASMGGSPAAAWQRPLPTSPPPNRPPTAGAFPQPGGALTGMLPYPAPSARPPSSPASLRSPPAAARPAISRGGWAAGSSPAPAAAPVDGTPRKRVAWSDLVATDPQPTARLGPAWRPPAAGGLCAAAAPPAAAAFPAGGGATSYQRQMEAYRRKLAAAGAAAPEIPAPGAAAPAAAQPAAEAGREAAAEPASEPAAEPDETTALEPCAAAAQRAAEDEAAVGSCTAACLEKQDAPGGGPCDGGTAATAQAAAASARTETGAPAAGADKAGSVSQLVAAAPPEVPAAGSPLASPPPVRPARDSLAAAHLGAIRAAAQRIAASSRRLSALDRQSAQLMASLGLAAGTAGSNNSRAGGGAGRDVRMQAAAAALCGCLAGA